MEAIDPDRLARIADDGNAFANAIANIMAHEFGHQVGLQHVSARSPSFWDQAYPSVMTIPLMPGTIFSDTPRLWP